MVHDRAVQLQPENAKHYIHRAHFHYFLGRGDEAALDLITAVELDPENAQYCLRQLRKIRKDLGPSEALTLYSRVISKPPACAVVYETRAHMHKKQEMYLKAIADFDRAIELVPEYAQNYVHRGLCQEKLGKVESAVEDYEAAAALYLTQNTPRARGLYDKIVKLQPENASAYGARGDTYGPRIRSLIDDEDYLSATQDYNRAVELEPDNASHYIRRGNFYSALDQHNKALSDFNIAIKLEPKNAEYYLCRGKVFSNPNVNNSKKSLCRLQHGFGPLLKLCRSP